MACGTPASVAHRRLASVRPISTTARRTCGRTSPPGPRVCTALATTLRTERTARVTAFAASFGAGDDLGQFDYFLPRLLDAGAEALFVIHTGGFVLTARACCFCLRRGLGRGMASRFTGQLVCCSCLGVLIRSVNQVRTVGPTTHARGPRPGPDPHPWADLLPLHLHDCKHRLTHPATGHTRARRPRLPLQSPSATAKLPDQPSNPPQATAPSFSLVGPASLSRSNRRGLAVVRWKGVNLNGAWRVRKLVAVEPSSGCHTRAPESNRAESLLEAPLRRAVLEAVQVDRTESFFGSGAEWRRVRYGPQ